MRQSSLQEVKSVTWPQDQLTSPGGLLLRFKKGRRWVSIKNYLQYQHCHDATRVHSMGGVGEGGSVVLRKLIRF